MIKEEIMDDENFRKRCSEYGLDWQNFEIYNDVIVLNAPKKGIYVLFDKNYNTIAIHRIEFANMHLTMQQIVEGYSQLYNYIDEKDGYSFSYPFQNFSLKQLVELSKGISIHETNHGHSKQMIFNGRHIVDENNENYIGLLSYIKFLGDQIKQYYLNEYKMKLLGLDYPAIHLYINRIMANINECVENSIKNGCRIFLVDINRYLGCENEYDIMLYDVINLLYRENGVKIKPGIENCMKIEKCEKSSEDLSILSTNLLKLLNIFDGYPTVNGENQYIDLSSYLNGDDIPKDKPPVFMKK